MKRDLNPPPFAPPTEEELREAERLRKALDESGSAHAHTPEMELALSLRAAWSPSVLRDAEARAVANHAIERVSPEAADSPRADHKGRTENERQTEGRDAAEHEAAAVLREALLGGPSDADGLSALATSLRAAYAPNDLPAPELRTLVEAALVRSVEHSPDVSGPVAPVASLPSRKARGTVVSLGIGLIGGGLALAASVAFLVSRPAATNELPLARARSTQELFREPFKAGESSARIDRIASARASDLRNNHFARWGVR
jgi:hypothetical protein